MNNAGTGGGGQLFGDPRQWEAILNTNLWGVINGTQIFAPAMADQGTSCAIINTGSKQGITTPPGNTAYNVSKAGVRVVTEALAHELRNKADCHVTAHLLIPGFVYTGLTKAAGVTENLPAHGSLEQVVDFMLSGMARGDFYILCPDNETSREVDVKRIRWSAEDIIQNRPALSRWHPDYKEAFRTFLGGVAGIITRSARRLDPVHKILLRFRTGNREVTTGSDPPSQPCENTGDPGKNSNFRPTV